MNKEHRGAERALARVPRPGNSWLTSSCSDTGHSPNLAVHVLLLTFSEQTPFLVLLYRPQDIF